MRIWSVMSAEGGRTFFYKRDNHTPARALASFSDDQQADVFLRGMQAAFEIAYKDVVDLAQLIVEEQRKKDVIE